MNVKKLTSGYIFYLLLAAVIVFFLFSLNIVVGPTYGGDSEWYVAAAEGRFHELIVPYSSRFLHPFMVGFFSRLFSFEVYPIFLAVTAVSVFLFLVTNSAFLKKILNSPLLLIPIFLLPYFFATLREIFQPDAFYIFLTALFFLFLFYQKESASLLVLFLLFLTRESTIILGLIFIILSWLRSKKILALTALVVVAISFYVTSAIGSIGQPNVHQLNGLVYLPLKFVYNFAANVFGVKLWVNTYTSCEPAFQFNLPAIPQLGVINKAGFCGFDFSLPLYTLFTLLTIFGVGPLLLFSYLKRQSKKIFKEFAFWIVVALIYGLAHFFIGVFAGTVIQRIVGYSWPAFLLINPFLIKKFFICDRKFIMKLSMVQILVAWLPFMVYRTGSSVFFAIAAILLAVVGYYYAFRLIKNQNVRI